jgi:hypothetical protein
MSDDNNGNSNGPFDRYSGVAAPDRAQANAERAERLNMVEHARQVDAARKRTESMPDPLPPQRSLEDMVPPGVDANEYISRMLAKSEGAGPSYREVAAMLNNPAGRGAPLEAPRGPSGVTVDANILSTATTRGGAPVAVSQLKGEHIVRYGNMEMTVAEAVGAGLVDQDGNGRYFVPGSNTVDAAQEVEAQKAEAQREAELPAKRAAGEAPDAGTQATLEFINGYIPPQAADALAFDYVKHGDISLTNIDRVAQSIGLSSEQARNVVSNTVTGLQSQADKLATTLGVPSSEVSGMWNWCSQNYPSEHRNAALALYATKGTETGGLKRLVQRYVAHMRHSGRQS